MPTDEIVEETIHPSVKLYHWYSHCFSDFLYGDIFAVGISVEDARARALEHYRDHPQYLAIEDDLMREPKYIHEGLVAHVVNGS